MAYLNIPEIYWDDETLNNDERVMLSIVHSYQGSCYWSISKWCEKFRQSKPTILGLIRTLEERGYLEAIRVNGKSTTYRILDQTGKKSLPVKKLDRTGKETLLVPVKNFDRTGKESLPYIYKYNNNDKKSYNNSLVADAPLPTETLLKNPSTDLDSVKEPLETLAGPETSDLTQPPQFREPPLPEPHRFVAAELSEAHRAKLLAQIKSPAQRAGLDPEKLLSEQLAACERWSHKDNKKDKFRDCWLATLQRQWIGKKIKELAANPKKPVGPSGLTYPQVETIFRDFWNEAHGLSRLDCRFVTEKQEPFIEKTYKTFARNENDFLEFLRKQDPHQFNKQWIQIWMQFKQIESEAAK